MFRRLLAPGGDPQVLVSPLDLHALLAAMEPPPPGRTQPAGAVLAPGAAGDAPRDDVEQTLAGMWCELLGAERVSLADGFFALGGHSLVAVRLFARIRKTWGVDLPLATLFAAPTLEALAARVREALGRALPAAAGPAGPNATPPAGRGWSPLVLVRKGGARPPFFCVHGAGGNLLVFRDLAERLDEDQPVFGLEARGVDGRERPSASIEEMAELYVEAVLTVRPRGPYLLGGYSGGGVAALEMARRLVAAGEDVPTVVLLDTFHPRTEARRLGLRDHVSGFATQGLAYLPRRARAHALRQLKALPEELRLRYYLSRRRAIPHDLREAHLTRHFLEIAKRHRPAPYPGPVTLFRAREVARVYAHMGTRLGWEPDLLPRLEVVEVPGNHDTIVREPNVGILASLLEDRLRRAADASSSGQEVRPRAVE